MRLIEDARFDLNEAHQSLNTAIDLLQSLDLEAEPLPPGELARLVERLQAVRNELEQSYIQLVTLEQATAR